MKQIKQKYGKGDKDNKETGALVNPQITNGQKDNIPKAFYD